MPEVSKILCQKLCGLIRRNAAQEAINEVPAVEPYEALKKKMMEAAEAAVEARRVHAVHDVSPACVVQCELVVKADIQASKQVHHVDEFGRQTSAESQKVPVHYNIPID